MKTKAIKIAFICFAVLSFCAALYHSAAFFYPVDNSPLWRHALFIGINTISIYGLLKRPNWFLWFWGVLTIQQLYSHGSYALQLWKTSHIIHWISIGVVILMPVVFALLVIDRKIKQ